MSLTPGVNHTSNGYTRFHVSFGKVALLQLLEFDKEMLNYCKNCADAMTADAVICPDCETEYALEGIVSGEDLVEARKQEWKCNSCDYSGPMQPKLTCNCGTPMEGRLTDFDIRMKRESTGEKSSVLKIVGVRKPLSTVKDEETRAAVEQMILNPLNLPAIFAPTRLEDQKKILGDLCLGLDPRAPKRDKSEADVEEFHHSPEEADDDLPFGK